VSKSAKLPSLLQYWTRRYVLTLIIGLVCIGVFTFLWIEYSFNHHQIKAGHQVIDEVQRAIKYGQEGINQGVLGTMPRFIEQKRTEADLNGNFVLLIIDNMGKPLFAKPEMLPEMRPIALQQARQLVPEDLYQNIQLRQNDKYFYLARNLKNSDGILMGHVYLLLPFKDISKSRDELTLMIILLGSAAILGWVIIYMLARRLVRPVQDIVEASRLIISGTYNVQLKREVKEREVHELQESFTEMAIRLNQLEYLRTKLLASVTHELKTPVTSISGIVQALRNEIVTGDDAKHFMDICFKESQRLHRMVEDLLEFNSFATGSIKVAKERVNISRFMDEMVKQWTMTQEGSIANIQVVLPEQPLFALTDASRLQQVFINLLDNAKAALHEGGNGNADGNSVGNSTDSGVADSVHNHASNSVDIEDIVITIRLYVDSEDIGIDVRDTGCGIAVYEQPLVFESFYRGEDKQRKVRGMGLGLPLCSLIMHALGGSIALKESSPQGTIFSLRLERVD
jgi:signal transduction histidine kinase